MKQLFIVCTLLITGLAQAHSHKDFRKKIPHILPDAPSSAYRGHYKSPFKSFDKNDPVNSAIQLGERNLEWLEYMNSFRDEENKLTLTKVGDLQGIPIESPKKYSDRTINAEYIAIEDGMPAAMKEILYSVKKEFTKNPPVDEETYIEWARKVDRNYQTATRWSMLQIYLPHLLAARQQDLRGYYFLSKKTENVEGTLRNFDSLPLEKQNQIKEWLQQMCQNMEGLEANCDKKVLTSVNAKKVYEFYLKYLSNSEEIWNSFFSLFNPRHEVEWTQSNPLAMVVPFRDPKNPVILNFLKTNIEDEWQWDQWKLILDFRPAAEIHVEFQPGVVPHVNGLGGDTIVMDQNAPLTEWDVQWTIRHEFGHVLGFTDCYLEFYEPKEQVIINYQLDVENLMCARSGRMQETHYQALKDTYLKPNIH